MQADEVVPVKDTEIEEAEAEPPAAVVHICMVAPVGVDVEDPAEAQVPPPDTLLTVGALVTSKITSRTPVSPAAIVTVMLIGEDEDPQLLPVCPAVASNAIVANALGATRQASNPMRRASFTAWAATFR